MTDAAPVTTEQSDADYQAYLAWKAGEGKKTKAPDPLSADALMARIQRMQKQMDALLAAQGVPADPMDAAVKALIAHVNARQASNPQYDLSELKDQLENLPKRPTVSHAELVRETVADHRERYAPIFSGMAYIAQLARDLHKLTLQEKIDQDAEAAQTAAETETTPEEAE